MGWSGNAFHWRLDTTRFVQCLDVGATHVLTGTEEGSGGEVAPATVTSNTVELDWGVQVHPKIVVLLLAKVGIHIREADVVNYVESQRPQTR